MTERKPPDVSWESWIEHQIEVGQRQGAFDDLPGHGKPIADLDRPHDDLWWVKDKLRREGVNHLPPTLAIRHERDVAVDAAMNAASEVEVRAAIDVVNERIRYINSHATAGPPSTVTTLDADVIVERWRTAHPTPEDATVDLDPTDPPPHHRRRWLRAILRRLTSAPDVSGP